MKTKTVLIERIKKDTYNVVDRIYINNRLQFEQSNLTSKNRFGAKQYKCNNGNVLNVTLWKWAQ